uniref:1,3-beta-glucan synthase n=1 Tax=Aegilops tauschii subsp. strangulata TaxID=200361 RepID=A0A453Q8C2_AEGTS
MAFELYGMLAGNVSPTTGENVKPAYGGAEEAFLKKVVTPIYKIIEMEAERSKTMKSKHSHWRNYDDLNEYFWSRDCFRLGWPMRADADFFKTPNFEHRPAGNDHWMGKVNFVEIRSFWHIFRSFDRMWSFLILSLQAMVIVAWNGGTPGDIFDAGVFKQVLSIFITAAVMKMGQAILDIVLSWKARRSMSLAVKLRYILKLLSGAAWVVILPVTYAYTSDNPTGLNRTIKSWFGDGRNQPSLYILAVVIYLSPNMLAATLFIFPVLRRFLEKSNLKVVALIMWWSQPRLFVGRGMHEGAFSLFKYTMFWVVLLATKLVVSFYVEIRPLVQPTKDIMKVPITTFQWHEFFPHAKNNIGVVIALWAPIILVYFMDTQIWYAIFSTLVGGIYGACRRLGEKPEDGKEEDKIAARFAQIWNLIITSFRQEDLIDNREKDLLLVPYCKDREMDMIQWPPFLLASKIPIALDMAADSGGKDRDLKKRMNSDPYFTYAIKECYASFKNVIYAVVVGPRERDVIQKIFKVVDDLVAADTLIKDLHMSNLPTLSKKFIELLVILQKNNKDDLGQVIILFQDMLEVVTRDIMEDQLTELLEPVHGGNNRKHEGITPLDQQEQEQLFTKAVEFEFPVKASDAWKEKIKRLHLLLTVKESAMDVPTNLDARRRISFFANSLFMDMPKAPKVRNMLPFSVLTPYYKEDVLFSSQALEEENEDGVSILFYLQKIYPDEWKNFLERVDCKNEEELRETEQTEDELRLWASYRGQTLTRTVRGMMYYRQALVLQSCLDMAPENGISISYGRLQGCRYTI